MPVHRQLETLFWSKARDWRPAVEWAAFFAATRHEVLEALLEADDRSVELDVPLTYEDCCPPSHGTPEPWPPTRIRVALAPASAVEGEAATRDDGKLIEGLLPPLSEDQEVRVPLRLLLGSLGVILLAIVISGLRVDFRSSAQVHLLDLLIANVTGFVGCLIAGRMVDIEFGPVKGAALKLLAVFTAAQAVDSLTVSLLTLTLLGWATWMVISLLLLAWLLRMDPLELGVTVLVIFFLRAVVWIAI